MATEISRKGQRSTKKSKQIRNSRCWHGVKVICGSAYVCGSTKARERHKDLPGDQGERKTQRPTWRPRREKDTKTYLATKARERHKDLPGDQGERKTQRPTWRPRREKDTKIYLTTKARERHEDLPDDQGERKTRRPTCPILCTPVIMSLCSTWNTKTCPSSLGFSLLISKTTWWCQTGSCVFCRTLHLALPSRMPLTYISTFT